MNDICATDCTSGCHATGCEHHGFPDRAPRPGNVVLTLNISASEVEVLEIALARARASERSEVTRARVLVTTGYGDRAGGTLDAESDRAALRVMVLNKVIDALANG